MLAALVRATADFGRLLSRIPADSHAAPAVSQQLLGPYPFGGELAGGVATVPGLCPGGGKAHRPICKFTKVCIWKMLPPLVW